jgi:hypothetical protein
LSKVIVSALLCTFAEPDFVRNIRTVAAHQDRRRLVTPSAGLACLTQTFTPVGHPRERAARTPLSTKLAPKERRCLIKLVTLQWSFQNHDLDAQIVPSFTSWLGRCARFNLLFLALIIRPQAKS